jgi:hypothetical protein
VPNSVLVVTTTTVQHAQHVQLFENLLKIEDPCLCFERHESTSLVPAFGIRVMPCGDLLDPFPDLLASDLLHPRLVLDKPRKDLEDQGPEGPKVALNTLSSQTRHSGSQRLA